MGNFNKYKSLEMAEKTRLMSNFEFSESQIDRLYRSFQDIDVDNKNYLTFDDFMKIEELADNILGKEIARNFFRNKNSRLNFEGFVEVLNIFRDKEENIEKKIRFIFDLYDSEQTGVITIDDLSELINRFLGDSISQNKIDSMLEEIMYETNSEDQCLSFELFLKNLQGSDLDKKLNFQCLL